MKFFRLLYTIILGLALTLVAIGFVWLLAALFWMMRCH